MAEFGFFGVLVVTLTQTPRLKGEGEYTGRFLIVLKLRRRAPDLGFRFGKTRFLFISWLMVGKAKIQNAKIKIKNDNAKLKINNRKAWLTL